MWDILSSFLDFEAPGLGELANFVVDEFGNEIVGEVVSDIAGDVVAESVAQIPIPPPQPEFTHVGESILDEFGNTDMDPTYPISTGGDIIGQSSTVSIPSGLSNVIGQIMGAVIPSADASVIGAAGRILTGGATMAGGAMAIGAGISGAVAGALMRLRTALTGISGNITPSALAAFGQRAYNSIATWVRANPGTSAITLLTGLGLTVEQAASFLGWGAMRKKRTRGKGISFRDMRTTRRTMRKVITMSQSLRHLCAAVPHRAKRRV